MIFWIAYKNVTGQCVKFTRVVAPPQDTTSSSMGKSSTRSSFKQQPFAYNHCPCSTCRQFGHCILPFALKADPIQSARNILQNALLSDNHKRSPFTVVTMVMDGMQHLRFKYLYMTCIIDIQICFSVSCNVILQQSHLIVSLKQQKS